MQGGCKPEGGAVAPVAELLSGAGLRVSEHGGDWALLRAGSLLWRGPHCPADPTGLQEAPGPAHWASAPAGPPSRIFRGRFPSWSSLQKRKRRACCKWLVGGVGSLLVFPGVQCLQGAFGAEPRGVSDIASWTHTSDPQQHPGLMTF